MENKTLNAYDKLRGMGIDFSTPRLPLYSLTGENAYLVGKFVEKQTIHTPDSEFSVLVFEVEDADLYDKNKNLVNVKNQKVGIFSSSKLESILFFDFVMNESGGWDKIENNKSGKRMALVYKGQKELKVGKRKQMMHTFSYKILD